jgi:signal peptidase I
MKEKFDNPELFDEKRINSKGNKILTKVFFAFFIIYILLFIVFMCFFIDFRVTFSCIPVKGASMQPTINVEATLSDTEEETHDWVYINHSRNINYGDIVVFQARKQSYDKEQKLLIKRVIALEGDAVSIRKVFDAELEKEVLKVCIVKAENIADSVITQNEIEILNEDYIASSEDWTTNASIDRRGEFDYPSEFVRTFFSSGNYNTIYDEDFVQYAIVPQGEFFYLGDNRAYSSDSEERGTDKVSSLSGIVQIIVPNAETASSGFKVQFTTAFNYYSQVIQRFFVNMWAYLENFFAI